MNTTSTRIIQCLAFAFMAAGLSWMGPVGCKKKEAPVEQVVPTPVPPPPSGSVVFTVGGHLARVDLQGGLVVPLTTGKSTEWFPVCAPTGDLIAYWSNAEKGIYNLWTVNMDGTQRNQLTNFETDSMSDAAQNLYLANAPDWSPDGKKIVYSFIGDLWEVDADGFNPRTLLTGNEALSPAYSPKEQAVIFVSRGQENVYNLYKLNTGTHAVTKITNYTDWNVGAPSYSEDGQRILCVLFRENVSQIYTMAADGTSASNLTTDNASLCPRYAQKDKKIVFCATGEDMNVEVYMMNANGTDRKKLSPMGGAEPSWAAYIPMVAVPTPVGQ